ncbi:MAG: hypothetical protein ACM3O7_07580 [Acidobacteriota bacterium]
MPWWEETFERIRFAVVSFATAVLPEQVKARGWLAGYASVAIHIVSGAVESVAAVGIFIVGMIAAVTGFARGPGWVYLSSRGSTQIGEWFAMGALGFLTYLLRPVSLLLLYCYAEGLIRILEAVFSGRMLGSALVALPWRGAVWLAGHLERAHTTALLGPPRPDEVVRPADSRSRLLEIYSCTEKPWSELQVIEFEGEFFQSVGRRLVPRGAHHAWRYLFVELHPGEVIRGALVHYGAAAASVPPHPPHVPKRATSHEAGEMQGKDGPR